MLRSEEPSEPSTSLIDDNDPESEAPSQLASQPSYYGAIPSAHRFLLFASLLNVAASAGYVTANYSRGFEARHEDVTILGFVVLAVSNVAAALLYLASWRGGAVSALAAAAEYVNISASVGYVLSSLMYPFEGSEAMTGAVLVLECALALAVVIDAGLYALVYITEVAAERVGADKPPVSPSGTRYAAAAALLDAEALGNMLNVGGSLLYVVGSACGLSLHYLAPSVDEDGSAVPSAAPAALRAASRVNVYGDALFLLSSVAFLAAWARDTLVLAAHSRSASGGGGGGGGGTRGVLAAAARMLESDDSLVLGEGLSDEALQPTWFALGTPSRRPGVASVQMGALPQHDAHCVDSV